MLTTEQFNKLTPWYRGYTVYMCGAREDQPNVPDEKNPYVKGSEDSDQWYAGAWSAYLEVLDSE
jgi:hypothetical protein